MFHFGSQDIQCTVGTCTIDLRHLLKWLFFQAVNTYCWFQSQIKKSGQVMTNISRPQFAAQLLESGKFEANLIHAVDFASVKLISLTCPKFFLAKKSESQQTYKQTVKHSSHNHGICHCMITFLNL